MKKRLDIFLVESNFSSSRTKAQKLIENGLVFVDGIVAKQPAMPIDENQKIEVKQHEEFVSRGAYKLLAGLEKFDVDLHDKVMLDIGASTGGFTQVALQKGAKKVYALDVGQNQLDKTLAQSKKVVNLSNTDIRNFDENLASDVQFLTGDLSFVSLTKILPIVFEKFGFLPSIFLFKPQFECGKEIAKKFKGIIKDEKIHKSLLRNFVDFLRAQKIKISGLTFSPITGGDGNIEYLFYLNGENEFFANIEKTVENAFSNLKKS